MEKFSRSKYALLTLGVLFFISSIAVLSCNSGGDREDDLNSGDPVVETVTPAGKMTMDSAAFEKTLNILYVLEDTFVRLATRRGSSNYKLAFQACVSPESPGKLTLRGWAGGNNNSFHNDTSIVLVVGPAHSTNLGSQFNLSTQVLRRPDVRDILALLNAPNSGKQIVAFYPLLRPDNYQLVYDVYILKDTSLLKSSPLTSDFRTNPSPPASFLDFEQ